MNLADDAHPRSSHLMGVRLRYLYRAYRYRWRVDRAELGFLCGQLRPGQVAVDVGCHKGAYTYWMRRCVGAKGHVYAFEPQPRQVAYLRNLFDAMRYRNVTLEAQGLSDTPGSLQLHIPAGAGLTHAASFVPHKAVGQTAETLQVAVTTLDAYFADRPRSPDFVKIDVEGHELAVLVGSRQTLAAHHPTLLVECEARHRPDGDVRPVFDLLGSLGYEGSFFLRGQRRPLVEFDPAIHQRIEPGTADLPPGYVNNFAFEHPDRRT